MVAADYVVVTGSMRGAYCQVAKKEIVCSLLSWLDRLAMESCAVSRKI